MSVSTDEFRGLRDALRAFVPIWLQDRPGFRNGYKFLYMAALLGDIAITWMVQAVYAWLPGYSLGVTGLAVDPSSALPLVGQGRAIVRGEIETDASYAARLVTWLTTWEAAGSAEILASQVQAYLANTPTVRIVDRAGNWVTIDPSGHITTTSAAWDWDSVSNPERAGWWSDLWVIVYPCEWPITGTNLASLVGAWGTYQGVGTGHKVPRAQNDAIRAIVAQWKGAHVWVEAIIWSYDATLFVPGAPVSGDPDGTWGNWSKYVGGVQVPARLNDGRVRFWIPNGG